MMRGLIDSRRVRGGDADGEHGGDATKAGRCGDGLAAAGAGDVGDEGADLRGDAATKDDRAACSTLCLHFFDGVRSTRMAPSLGLGGPGGGVDGDAGRVSSGISM